MAESTEKPSSEEANEDCARTEAAEEFTVEEILGKRFTPTGRVQYLLKWLGYPDSDNSWEDEDNLVNCPELIEEFERKQAEKEKRVDHQTPPTDVPVTPKNPLKEGYVPLEILGVTNVNQKLRFLIKFKGLDEAIFVFAKDAHRHCPDLVIEFYESKIMFAD